jgi:hypothetical protein
MMRDSSSAQTNTNTNPQTPPQTQALPQFEQDKILADLAKSIEGKEKEPAEKVWKELTAPERFRHEDTQLSCWPLSVWSS